MVGSTSYQLYKIEVAIVLQLFSYYTSIIHLFKSSHITVTHIILSGQQNILLIDSKTLYIIYDQLPYYK